jgi:hypothetical protein
MTNNHLNAKINGKKFSNHQGWRYSFDMQQGKTYQFEEMKQKWELEIARIRDGMIDKRKRVSDISWIIIYFDTYSSNHVIDDE